MARNLLVLGGRQIQTLEDLKKGFEASDAVREFRNGAITQWLRDRDLTDVLEQLESLDDIKSSDKSIAKKLLEVAGLPKSERTAAVKRITRELKQKKKDAKENNNGDLPASEELSQEETHSREQSSKNGNKPTMEDEHPFSLEEAFKLAVLKGEITDICKNAPNRAFKGFGTLGGKICWRNLAEENGWRLQRLWAGNWRIIDKDNRRWAYGVSLRKIERRFREWWDNLPRD